MPRLGVLVEERNEFCGRGSCWNVDWVCDDNDLESWSRMVMESAEGERDADEILVKDGDGNQRRRKRDAEDWRSWSRTAMESVGARLASPTSGRDLVHDADDLGSWSVMEACPCVGLREGAN